MSAPSFATDDPTTILADALATYKQATVTAANPSGITLAPADPRRLHLQALLLLLAQIRQNVNFAGLQNLLRYVSDQYIDEFAALWDVSRLQPQPSQCTERFLFPSSAPRTVPKGTRVTDGTNLYAVVADTSAIGTYIDATVACTVAGGATNGIAIGQIDTLVDPDLVPGCIGVSNQSETVSGRDLEGTEDFRTRLRDAPEAQSAGGPRIAYEEAALAASASVADAVALGPDDYGDLAGAAPDPGNVQILIIEGTRDVNGVLTSVVPDPGFGVLLAVSGALTAETFRPMGDNVITLGPQFVDFNAYVTYYIAESRSESASEIQAAAQTAFDAYLLWQQSKIGRDINPSELTTRLGNAGAKRVVITEPAFTQLMRDQSARLGYSTLTYGGVEDD